MGAIVSIVKSWWNPSQVAAVEFAEYGDLGSEADVPDPNSGLTLRHRKAIVRTWGLVKPDLKKHGGDFFLRLFRTEPALQTRFKGFAGKTEAELANSKRLLAHGTTVLMAISSLVDNLDDVMVLVELLKSNAVNHKNRGIMKEDFQKLSPVLIAYLRDSLGSAWTPVSEEGWTKALEVIVSITNSVYEEDDAASH